MTHTGKYLSLSQVSKTYPNGVHALSDISLDIEDGAFVVVIGPSGCGKSTLLRVTAGLEAATTGDIWLAGRRVNQVDASDRDLAMVFQSYALYPHMTVRANMVYGLKRRNLSRHEIDRRIDETAHILKLGEVLGRKPAQLSGGQRQRVAMGRAIVRQPKAFLLDEPLSNLDAHLRGHMRGELKNLHGRLRTTFLYVTHDQAEAMTLGDRIVVMRGGRIVQQGSPETLYKQPVNLFVARFIGTPGMNIVKLTQQKQNGGYLGFRPEAARIHPANKTGSNSAAGDTRFAGKVTAIDYMGSDYFIAVLLDGVDDIGGGDAGGDSNGDTGDNIVRIRTQETQSIQAGDKVVVAVAEADLCRFDARGNAIAPK